MAHPDLLKSMKSQADGFSENLDYSKFRAFEALNDLPRVERLIVLEFFCPNCGILEVNGKCECVMEELHPRTPQRLAIAPLGTDDEDEVV